MKRSESASSSDLRENHEVQSDRELIFTTLENSHTQRNNLCDVESRNGTARRSQAVKSPANRCGVFYWPRQKRKKAAPIERAARTKNISPTVIHYLDHLDLFK